MTSHSFDLKNIATDFGFQNPGSAKLYWFISNRMVAQPANTLSEV